MNISQNGIDLIKSFEGCKLTAYKPVPTEEHWTIGFGHYGSDVRHDKKITENEAEDLLKKDLQKYVNGVEKAVTVTINQNQFDALVSFTYNLGIGALQKSTLLQLINKKYFKDASKEFGKWVNSNGKPLAGLVKRRTAEMELFLKPVTKSAEAKKPVASSKKYTSLVDCLNAHNLNSSFDNRKAIARMIGIKNYSGTAEQNQKMLDYYQD